MTGRPRQPRLSVVMPVHDVEQYLPMAVASLRAQTMTDFEVVLVDDGSSDSSPEIAAEVAAADPRFRVLHTANRGPGVARNTGIAEAHGEYLTFIDSDDYVPRYAFETMLRSLETTGSDFAAGNARRFDLTSVWQSWAHGLPFAKPLEGTSLREHPALANDRTPWGKYYRRSFWDAAGLEFPDMLYEDYPVNIAAYARAERIDVISKPTYYWRVRDGVATSITQQHWHVDNMADRVRSAELVLDVVDREAPEAREVVQNVLLSVDAIVLARSVEDHTGADREAVLDLAARLIGRLDPAAIASRDAFDRVAIDLLRRRRAPELAELIRYLKEHGRAATPVQRNGRWFQQLPWFEDASVGVPDECYEIGGEQLVLTAQVSDAQWRADGIVLDVDVSIATLLLGPETRLRAWFEHDSGARVEPSIRRLPRERHGLGTDQSTMRIHLDRFGRLLDAARGGAWRLMVSAERPEFRDTAAVENVARGRARWLGHRQAAGAWILPQVAQEAFTLFVRRPAQWVERCIDLGDELEIVGSYQVRDDVPGEPTLVLEGPDGVRRSFPVESEVSEDRTRAAFVARVDPAALVDHDNVGVGLEEMTVHMARLAWGEDQRRLAAHPHFLGAAATSAGRNVTATVNPMGFLVVIESPARVWVEDTAWTGPSLLTFRGACLRSGEPAGGVLLRHWATPDESIDVHVTPEVKDGHFSFTVDVADLVERLERTDRGVLRSSGRWLLLSDTETPTPIRMPRYRISETVDPRTFAGRTTKLLLDRTDELILTVR